MANKVTKVDILKSIRSSLDDIMDSIPSLFKNEPKMSSAVETIFQSVSTTHREKGPPGEVYKSVGEYYKVLVTKSTD